MSFVPRLAQWTVTRWFVPALVVTLSAGLLVGAEAALRTKAGYKDFSYRGTSNLKSPTAEKPESKLWYHDGLWWGSLFEPKDPGVGLEDGFYIHKLDPANLEEGWVNTKVPLDLRNTSQADALLDGSTLYVVSHITDQDAVPDPVNAAKPKEFYRFTYNSSAKTWTKQTGPITINNGSSETLVLAKDSTGQLWVTYVQNGNVELATSTDGENWTTFTLPTPTATNLTEDDISTIVAFQGRIGVMWSNQTDKRIYFATHPDSRADTEGWVPVIAFSTSTGSAADDHINLKVQADARGRLFAVVKTELPAGSADIVVLECLTGACDGADNWQAFPVYPSISPSDPEHTRPVLLVEGSTNTVHVFTTQPTTGGAIYRKSASIGQPFDISAPGVPFIQGDSNVQLNDATTTKQTVNKQSGMVVLASDTANEVYYFGFLRLTTSYLPSVFK